MRHLHWNKAWHSLALLAVAALFYVDRSTDAQEKKPSGGAGKPAAPANPNQPFAGKVLLVQKKQDASPTMSFPGMFTGLSGYVLENAELVEIGGSRWLAGHGIERVDDKAIGPRTLIRFDEVATILEFDKVEDYKEFEEQQLEKMRQNNNFFEMAPAMPLGPPNVLEEPAERPDA